MPRTPRETSSFWRVGVVFVVCFFAIFWGVTDGTALEKQKTESPLAPTTSTVSGCLLALLLFIPLRMRGVANNPRAGRGSGRGSGCDSGWGSDIATVFVAASFSQQLSYTLSRSVSLAFSHLQRLVSYAGSDVASAESRLCCGRRRRRRLLLWPKPFVNWSFFSFVFFFFCLTLLLPALCIFRLFFIIFYVFF